MKLHTNTKLAACKECPRLERKLKCPFRQAMVGNPDVECRHYIYKDLWRKNLPMEEEDVESQD